MIGGWRRLRPRAVQGTPTATVVVPCYNYGHYLPQLLADVLDQPGVDVDVIVVDDASPDGSGEVAERLAADLPRVRVIRHETNKGHIQTYNDGLAAATGEFVTLISADDLLPRAAISRAVALMQAQPRVGFVYGYARSFSGTAPAPVPTLRSWTVWDGHAWIAESLRQARCLISSPEVVMRTEALRQVGDYDARLPHSADFELWLRTALDWDVARVNGPDQALYRVHDTNMHLTTFAGYARDLLERRETFDIFFAEHAPIHPDVARRRQSAVRALAHEGLRRGLAAARDGDDDVAREFVGFARETDPTIVDSLGWRAWQAGPGRGRSLPLPAARRFGAKVRHHLLWRRERRYGF